MDARSPVPDAMRQGRLLWLTSQEEVARHYPQLGLVVPYDFMLAAAPFTSDTAVRGGIALLWPVSHPPQLSPHQRETITMFCQDVGPLLEQNDDRGPRPGETACHGISGYAYEGADRQTAMSTGLPFFRYHPDPVATGSIRKAAETCACCERDQGWIYTATFYTAREVDGRFCPWCIADGSAAERFEGEFADSIGLGGVGDDVLHEVTRRTPGFHAWQDPRWLVHCRTAAAFVGEVGYAELAARPDALAQLRADMRLDGWREEAQLEQFLTRLGKSATALLFRCTVCGSHLAYVDAS